MVEQGTSEQDRRQAARDRLRELNESIQERHARSESVPEEEWLSRTQCCANCVFYRRHTGTRRTISSGRSGHETWDNCYCQRNPPSLVAKELVQFGGFGTTPTRHVVDVELTWPQTKRTDWCGEYRPLPGFDETVVPSNRIEGFRPEVGTLGESRRTQRPERLDE